jgi:hypothetical protein
MVTQLKEWTREEVWALVGTEQGTCEHGQTVAVYGASVISIQQVQKWCCYFPIDQAIVTDRDRTGNLSHKAH